MTHSAQLQESGEKLLRPVAKSPRRLLHIQPVYQRTQSSRYLALTTLCRFAHWLSCPLYNFPPARSPSVTQYFHALIQL